MIIHISSSILIPLILVPVVPGDLYYFPPHEVARHNWSQAKTQYDWVISQQWQGQHIVGYGDLLIRSELGWRAWSKLDDAWKCEKRMRIGTQSHKYLVSSLKELRAIIGQKRYYSGRMPCPFGCGPDW